MLNVRPGRPVYDGIDFLRSGDRKRGFSSHYVLRASQSGGWPIFLSMLRRAGFSRSSSLGFTPVVEWASAARGCRFPRAESQRDQKFTTTTAPKPATAPQLLGKI